MVHSEVYLNKYVVSIAPFSTPAWPDCSKNIQKTVLFCTFSSFNFSSIYPGGSADPICPYVRTPMGKCPTFLDLTPLTPVPRPAWGQLTLSADCRRSSTDGRCNIHRDIRETSDTGQPVERSERHRDFSQTIYRNARQRQPAQTMPAIVHNLRYYFGMVRRE